MANAVLHGMLDSEFEDLEVYSEVLQDAVLILWMLEKSILLLVVLSRFLKKMQQVFSNFEKYRDKLMMRPQEISNHPEIIRPWINLN